MAAKALGLAAIAVCDRNSLAGVVRAHAKAKELGLKFILGCRLDFADGSPSVLCYPTRPRGLRSPDQAAHRRPAARQEGRVRAHLGRPRRPRRGPARHRGPARATSTPTSQRRLERAGRDFAGRVWLAASRGYAAQDLKRIAALDAARPRRRRADRGDQRRALPRPRAAAAAGRADLHPREVHDRRGGPAARSQRRAAPEVAGRDGAAVPRLAGGGGAHAGDRRALHASRSASCATSTRTSRCRPARPPSAPERSRLGRRRLALSGRRAQEGGRPAEQGARPDRGARLPELLPHRARHRALGAGPGHPLPGPRLGGQFVGLLLPRRHRGRSLPARSTTCSSNASSPRSATSRPTSTSTSSTSGASWSCSTCTNDMAATAPPSAPPSSTTGRAAPSATSARRWG